MSISNDLQIIWVAVISIKQDRLKHSGLRTLYTIVYAFTKGIHVYYITKQLINSSYNYCNVFRRNRPDSHWYTLH